ncbi:polysaccharide pyruvyl transferase family protein [Catenibacterium sp. GCM10023432]|uniref:polysaccharide pyruvyl transferase family protein n=1 Tax=Catenibacterium sp. GCM10023432 TaxID=3252638 RepID=UPI003622391C
MKFFLYGHNGSGNHGCEAIVRSTYKILNKNNSNEFTLATNGKKEDENYGLNNIINLKEEKNNVPKINFNYIKAYLSLKLFKNELLSEELVYKKTFEHVEKDTIALSIGGDNYCYPGYERFIMLHNMLSRRGIKTVLWGCSVEPDSVDKLNKDLCNYDLIVARESISYEALKSIGANVLLKPDPAFWLDSETTEIDENLLKNSVGINISPMIINKEKQTGITLKNYINLIDYILDKTDMNIVLIPHVIWKDNNDDRKPLGYLYDLFKYSNRVLLINDQNCQKLKGIISKCRFFIGARTHSTIAAYSSCVPTLVVGYSVKAKGIAKDLFGTYKNYVIPVQSLDNENDLIDSFKWIFNREDEIRTHLINYIPRYKENIFNIEELEKL